MEKQLRLSDVLPQEEKLSGMMQDYLNVKKQYLDAVVFYRLGDFYEMFFDDAIEISRVLDITLTGRQCGLPQNRAPMCGVPAHAVDNYIAKLLREGYKIAICDQLGEGKGVQREVVRVITPGTVTEENYLEEKKNNYILCVYAENDILGVAYADISTGEFQTTQFNCSTQNLVFDDLNDLIVRIMPAEIICNNQAKEILKGLPANKVLNLPHFSVYYDWVFNLETCVEILKKQFGQAVLKIYDLNSLDKAIISCGALLEYLNETQKRSLAHIIKINKIDATQFMIVDVTARRNLELVETMRERKKKGSLLSLLDVTRTAMGSRLLRQWIEQPLRNSKKINERLDCIEELSQNIILRDDLSETLAQISDIERLTSKIGVMSIMPKDCLRLKNSLEALPTIKLLIENLKSPLIKRIYASLQDVNQIHDLLERAIDEEPSAHLRDGGYIKTEFDSRLKNYKNLKINGKDLMDRYELQQIEQTGIPNLRIKSNNVYGYFIEINKNLVEKVPINYHRKQTVANFDRYFTEELKELEKQITTASESAIKLEQEIFYDIRLKLKEYIEIFQNISKKIAELDCILSLTQVSMKNNYVKPIINDKIKHIQIVEGRHPVVENYVKTGQFIANDTFLNETSDKIMIITGPNMAGKSTYMRQVAIITLLAHIGCYVPAKSAEISITDRIFTRVGASDDLAFGQSTFMVEMTEMANILHNATHKSLIVLDEIGRGTSTFDGLSIAWAVVEYFSKKMKAKTLFATHYHELTELEGMLEGVKNYKINVKEINNTIVFLRKIVRGGASRSFGIEVASLAGLPSGVIKRAKEISHSIEQYSFNNKLAEVGVSEKSSETQNTAKYQKEIINMLKSLEIERLSPLESFEILSDLINKSKIN